MKFNFWESPTACLLATVVLRVAFCAIVILGFTAVIYGY
jgi:hypothetical protein